MKPTRRSSIPSAQASQVIETVTSIWSECRGKKLPLRILLGLGLNLLLAPAVLAASGSDFSRSQAYWVGALGLVTLALAAYLFVVMFAPEKF